MLAKMNNIDETHTRGICVSSGLICVEVAPAILEKDIFCEGFISSFHRATCYSPLIPFKLVVSFICYTNCFTVL